MTQFVPQVRLKRRAVLIFAVKAMIGTRGRSRAVKLAVVPGRGKAGNRFHIGRFGDFPRGRHDTIGHRFALHTPAGF